MRKRIRLRRCRPFTTHLGPRTAAVSRHPAPFDALVQALVGTSSVRAGATTRAAGARTARSRSGAARARRSASRSTRSTGAAAAAATTSAATDARRSTARWSRASTAGLHGLTRAAAELSASATASATSASARSRRIHGASGTRSPRVCRFVGATTERQARETQQRNVSHVARGPLVIDASLARFSRGHGSAQPFLSITWLVRCRSEPSRFGGAI
jgi:hypothetical protein